MSEMNVRAHAWIAGSFGSSSTRRTQHGWATWRSASGCSGRSWKGLACQNARNIGSTGMNSSSGGGESSGGGTCQSIPSSVIWNEAVRLKIALSSWIAVT